MKKFLIENLSYGQADCFLIMLENEQGDTCTILVDGNREEDMDQTDNEVIERVKALEKLDFIVVTHCDNDHLGGILKLFEKYNDSEKTPNLCRQLAGTIIIYNRVTDGKISYKQAEKFEELMKEKKVINTYSHQYDNENRLLKILSLDKRKLLAFHEKNRHDAFLTFLNPDKKGIEKVFGDYHKYCASSKGQEYSALINRQSIAFLLEFAGKKVLFLGDAIWKDIEIRLGQLSSLEHCDIIKIPHHGAEKNNIGIVEWAKNKKCRRYLVTGKEIWDEIHPQKELIEELYSEFGDYLVIYTNIKLSGIKKSGCIWGYGKRHIDVIEEAKCI